MTEQGPREGRGRITHKVMKLASGVETSHLLSLESREMQMYNGEEVVGVVGMRGCSLIAAKFSVK